MLFPGIANDLPHDLMKLTLSSYASISQLLCVKHQYCKTPQGLITSRSQEREGKELDCLEKKRNNPVHHGALTFLISKAVWTVFGTQALTQIIEEKGSVKKAAPLYNYFVPWMSDEANITVF